MSLDKTHLLFNHWSPPTLKRQRPVSNWYQSKI